MDRLISGGGLKTGGSLKWDFTVFYCINIVFKDTEHFKMREMIEFFKNI